MRRFLIITVLLIMAMCTIVYADKYSYPDLVWQERLPNGHMRTVVHSAAKEITKATNIGVIDGYPDGTFKPNDPIKKSEFIKSLIVLATNRTFDFTNVDSKYNAWYGPYVTIAEMQGVIEKNQYTEKELEEPITRLEMILMLAKTQIKMKGIPQNQMGTLTYSDIGYLTQEEKDLIIHAQKYDLLEGMRDGTTTLLKPDQLLTRGEAAAALIRIY